MVCLLIHILFHKNNLAKWYYIAKLYKITTVGFAAGGYYGNTGEGVNYQCLHTEPEYSTYNTGGHYSVISGAEYQSLSYGIFPNAAHDKNVPCARCYTQRSATVMIPSRRSCPTGWTKEYEGMHLCNHTTCSKAIFYQENVLQGILAYSNQNFAK